MSAASPPIPAYLTIIARRTAYHPSAGRCPGRRLGLLTPAIVSVDESAACTLDRTFAQRLLSMDEEVRTAILVARRDLRLIGGGGSRSHRHLHRLRESNGQPASDRVTIHREA